MGNWLVNEAEQAVATLILAHGAGAGAGSDFMCDIARELAKYRVRVVRFNFPYMEQIAETGKKRPPDKISVLEASFRQTVDAVSQQWPEQPIYIGGKSMGGRVATLLLENVNATGAIVLGYPFHPPGKPEKLRTAHLEVLTKPLLIVQGERDTFGKRHEIVGYALSAHIQMAYLSDGDHSFKPRKASGLSQADHIVSAAQICAQFVEAQR